MKISFFVPGHPATAGSKKPFLYKDKYGKAHASMAPDNKRQKPWMQTVSAIAKLHYSGPLLDVPLEVKYEFCFLRPASHYNSKGQLNKKGRENLYKMTKPDLGKLVRAVEDALTGVIWRDDARVVFYTCAKRYVERDPGVKIDIEESK
jgi:Holliday junction resolvase RusA-like endonuclease